MPLLLCQCETTEARCPWSDVLPYLISDATPGSAGVSPAMRVCYGNVPYRIFNVLNETNASVMAIIQNRTMTLHSGHPFSSKW